MTAEETLEIISKQWCSLEDYEDIADAINHGYYGKTNKNKDDFEIER